MRACSTILSGTGPRAGGGIPESQLLHYLLEAAEVLDEAHFQHGLQHLDVKPANLLIVNRHLKLADFGLVRPIQNSSADAGVVQPGVTPRYASPEMMQGKVSFSSDQYSLAIVYQELLTGDLPFSGNSIMKRLLAARTCVPFPRRTVRSSRGSLSVNPEDRFKSCLDFMHAILAARPVFPPEASGPNREVGGLSGGATGTDGAGDSHGTANDVAGDSLAPHSRSRPANGGDIRGNRSDPTPSATRGGADRVARTKPGVAPFPGFVRLTRPCRRSFRFRSGIRICPLQQRARRRSTNSSGNLSPPRPGVSTWAAAGDRPCRESPDESVEHSFPMEAVELC